MSIPRLNIVGILPRVDIPFVLLLDPGEFGTIDGGIFGQSYDNSLDGNQFGTAYEQEADAGGF